MTEERILLVDVDSTIPNLALMKVSAHYKSLGHEVGFNVDNPTKIYVSTIFTRNRHKTDGLHFFYPDAVIDIGGSGVDVSKKLDFDDLITPDYGLYPDVDYDMGFTTRGCIRNCYFCIVREKEGRFRRVQHPSEFHDPEHKKAMLMDNNILADKDWFFTVTDWLIENNISVDFNQGLDIRLMDSDIAERLTEVRHFKPWKFAFDDMSVRPTVEKGIQILADAGMHLKRNVIFYVYCHGDEQFDDALERCKILRSHNVGSFPMYNQHAPRTRRMTDLKRWALPQVYWSIDFDKFRYDYRSNPEVQVNMEDITEYYDF